MQKGESIIISASTPQFISENWSPEGKQIKRVRISRDEGILSSLFAYDEMAEFVDLDQVTVTCVPSSLYKAMLQERFPDIVEIPWEEDPLAFRL
jgi:hypothetical protein